MHSRYNLKHFYRREIFSLKLGRHVKRRLWQFLCNESRLTALVCIPDNASARRFWEREYSLPAGHGSACSHSWSRCQRRYLYSLRHMYGLEGRRVAFGSHSCRRLQVGAGRWLVSTLLPDLIILNRF